MSNALPFPIHFFRDMLFKMGWPRSRGLIRKQFFVDASIVDFTVEMILKNALALAVAKPSRAMQVFAEDFDRDWSRESPANILDEFLMPEVAAFRASNAPWADFWKPYRLLPEGKLASDGMTVSWNLVTDERQLTQIAAVHSTLTALGLVYPADAKRAFARDRAENEPKVERAIRAGLAVDAENILAPVEGLANEWDGLLCDYEAEFGKLPPTPAEVELYFHHATGA